MSLSRNASVILLASLSFAATGCNLEPSPAVEAGAKLKQTIDKASKLMAEAAVEDPEEVVLVDEEVSDFVQIECVSG